MATGKDNININYVGRRVEVFWPQDDEYYAGKVTKKRKLQAEKKVEGTTKRPRYEYLIEYDDGDVEWVDLNNDNLDIRFTNKNLCKEQRQKLMDEASKLKINSKVFVWWPLEKTYFPGTVDNILKGVSANSRPHHIRYDDGDEEWTNLNFRKFKFQNEESSSSATDRSISNAVNELDGSDENSRTPPLLDKKVKSESTNTNSDDIPKIDKNPSFRKNCGSGGGKQSTNKDDQDLSWKETCRICNKVAKRPRATSCHHIFCKTCIKTSSRNFGKKCPICDVRVESKIQKYDENLDSFKGVEALDMNTAEVVFRFNTASAASLNIEKVRPFRIIEACNSKRRNHRQCGGYYWRFQDHKNKGDKHEP